MRAKKLTEFGVWNLAAHNREPHDSQNHGPGIARNSAARSQKMSRIGVESWNQFRVTIRITSYQCLKRPWNHPIRLARFWVARFSIENRRFSATKVWNRALSLSMLKLYSLKPLYESGPRSSRRWNFEILGVKNVEEFWWHIQFPPGKKGLSLTFVTKNFTTFCTKRKKLSTGTDSGSILA